MLARTGMIQVNGDPLAWSEGMTVRDILVAKNYTFPLLIVTINDELIARQDYIGTLVPEGADVKVVHLMSGG